MNAFCDVLVVGAGEAGQAAADAVAKAGLRVILADANAPSGVSIDGVQILSRTFVWGVYDGNTYAATERVADHKPDRKPGEPRQRYWVIRARTAILATGANERPLVFPGNDLPGVMLCSMLSQLAGQGIAPSAPVCLFTNNDSAYQTAADLAGLGAKVAAIIDVRREVSNAAKALAKVAGAEVIASAAIVATDGKKVLNAIRFQSFDAATGTLSVRSAGSNLRSSASPAAGHLPSSLHRRRAAGQPGPKRCRAFCRRRRVRALPFRPQGRPMAFSASKRRAQTERGRRSSPLPN